MKIVQIDSTPIEKLKTAIQPFMPVDSPFGFDVVCELQRCILGKRRRIQVSAERLILDLRWNDGGSIERTQVLLGYRNEGLVIQSEIQ